MLESIDDKILKPVMKRCRGVVFLPSHFRYFFLREKGREVLPHQTVNIDNENPMTP